MGLYWSNFTINSTVLLFYYMNIIYTIVLSYYEVYVFGTKYVVHFLAEVYLLFIWELLHGPDSYTGLTFAASDWLRRFLLTQLDSAAAILSTWAGLRKPSAQIPSWANWF